MRKLTVSAKSVLRAQGLGCILSDKLAMVSGFILPLRQAACLVIYRTSGKIPDVV
ncbi:MAG TPA: hypothetical protein VFK30_07585 [Anaerolineae bacterium]|nr:hypothetical protein [Anaerolineae bacterium]